jgi:hypothetical protein
MKFTVAIPIVLIVFVVGASGGWFMSRHFSDQRYGAELLKQINSDAAQQIAHYEKIQEILATGDTARLSQHLENQIEMARLVLESSEAAAKK